MFGLGSLPDLRGLSGAVVVLSALSYPYVFLPVAARMRSLNPSLEESARLLGRSSRRVFLEIVVPQVAPAVTAGAVLVFLYSLSDFGVVQFVRYDTLTRVIYESSLTDRVAANAVGLLLGVIAIAVSVGERTIAHRVGAPPTSPGRAPRPIPLGRWKPAALAATAAVLIGGLVGPLSVLCWWVVRGARNGQSLTGNDPPGPAIGASLMIGILAALVAVAVVLPIVFASSRRRSRAGEVASAVVTAGFALPGLVTALSMVVWSIGTPLYQSLTLLVIAHTVHFGAQALRGSTVAVEAVPARYDEAGRLLGVGRIRRFTRIELPLLLPGLAAAGGLVLLSVIKELPMTLLLRPIRLEPLSFWIWDAAQNAVVRPARVRRAVDGRSLRGAHRTARRSPGGAGAMTRARRAVAVGLLVAVVAACGIDARATVAARTTVDEPHYLLSALVLWEDGSLDYGAARSELRYRPFHEVLLPIQAATQPDGQRIAPHDPLLPAILAAPMGLGGWRAAKATMAVLAGILAGLLCWVLEQRLRVRGPTAAAVAVLAGCSPPMVVYGTQIYPELPGALAALIAFALITSPRTRPATVIGALAAISALPWLSVKYAPVAIVLAAGLVTGLWTARRWALLGALAVGGALSAAVFAVAHLAIYGGLTPYATGTHFGDGELSVIGHRPDYLARAQRLTGLLVEHDFGLAAWQPLALALFPALAVWIVERRRLERWLLPATFAAGWGTATFVALTMEGWWWPGRQTVVVLPLGVLVIGVWVDRWRAGRRRLACAVGLLGPWMFAWQLAEIAAGRHTLIVDFFATDDPLGNAWRSLLPDLRADTLAQELLHLGWAVAIVAGTALVARAAALGHRLPEFAEPGTGPEPSSSRPFSAAPEPDVPVGR